ncbi:bromodomain adjacent to zinc finger domain protein 1A-like [Episyrphus balteatus]|uniref:bromodomain adjacent to zinc finger domain protein 1A-like n=1 Tax=Episyrphus balteatus TaxID=286459 RepID=UPI002484F9BF|nr:bromodomain adjacent to zinc finger domain protein 1A-like [Episyrphus balteatus]
MPLCNHEEFKQLLRLGKRQKFRDENEKVFYCGTTKRIFRNYEQYAFQVLANSSTIWKCRVTGCENLTYEEALKSEQLALKSKHTLNENLCSVVLIFIKTVKQSSLKNVRSLCYEFIRNRFFVNERVKVLKESYKKTAFIITNVKAKSIILSSSDNISYEYKPDQVEYTVKNENVNSCIELTVEFEQIKRYRNALTFTFLKEFIEQNVINVDNILLPEPESYKKYVTDKNLSFDKVFIGKIPSFYNYERDKFVKEKSMILCKQTDDLERFDQKLLPKYEQVSTNIPIEYFGDAIMLNEFLHTFSKILCHKKSIDLSELTRVLTTIEIDGPLSEILINLLQTIFNFQKEEESEYPVWYTSIDENKFEIKPLKAMNEAYKTHFYISSHFSMKLYDLPLNTFTLSEVLRLHLLSSGAPVKDATEMFRQMYRSGYSSKEDPGLLFCIEQPHILDSLKSLSIFQLPTPHICQIINTLTAQILSYSPAINMIDKQMNRITQLKIEIEANRLLKKHLNKTIQTRVDSKEINKTRKLSNNIFGFKPFLGMDRAYRRYYVLRSIPGIFVEHPLDTLNECLQNPPTNVPSFVDHPKQKNLNERYLTKLYNKVRRNQTKHSSKSQNNNNLEYKNLNNQTLNDTQKIEEEFKITEDETNTKLPSQYELMMCTGSSTNCLVHDVNNSDRQRWAYFYKEEHIDAVIQSLNPFGERESKLKKSLSMMRDLIVDHVKNCPVERLSLNGSPGEKLFDQNPISTEELNEVLQDELRNQIFKLTNQIIACNLRTKIQIKHNPICSQDNNDVKLDSRNQELEIIWKCVQELCLLLLSVKQNIKEIYLKHQNLEQWEISLMESTSFSQVFLHLNILDRGILWSS